MKNLNYIQDEWKKKLKTLRMLDGQEVDGFLQNGSRLSDFIAEIEKSARADERQKTVEKIVEIIDEEEYTFFNGAFKDIKEIIYTSIIHNIISKE